MKHDRTKYFLFYVLLEIKKNLFINNHIVNNRTALLTITSLIHSSIGTTYMTRLREFHMDLYAIHVQNYCCSIIYHYLRTLSKRLCAIVTPTYPTQNIAVTLKHSFHMF